MAHKSPKWAVIMNSKTNSMQNKPINERKGKEMFVDFDVKNKYCYSLEEFCSIISACSYFAL